MVQILADEDRKWEHQTFSPFCGGCQQKHDLSNGAKRLRRERDIKIKSYLSRWLSIQHQRLISAEQHETIQGCRVRLSAFLGTWLTVCMWARSYVSI